MTTNVHHRYNVHQGHKMAQLKVQKIRECTQFAEDAVSNLKISIANLRDADISARRYSQLPAAMYFSDKIQQPAHADLLIPALRLTLHEAERVLQVWRDMLLEAQLEEARAAAEVDNLPPE